MSKLTKYSSENNQNFFEGKATSYMKAGLRGEHGSLTFTDIKNEEE